MKYRVVIATLALLCATLAVAQSTQAPATSQDSQQQSSQQPAAQTPNTQQPSQSPSTEQPVAQPSETQEPATQSSQTQQPAAESQDNQDAPQPPGAEPRKDANGSADTDPNKKLKGVKPGSENDVNAIGNRNIGKGKSLGDWYSLDSEIRMGKQYAQQIEASVKLNQDPVINEYINRIGQNLVRNSDARVPFTIKVVEDDSINAFALPGGFFYVNTGLILAADEEAELAGVMAHEIAHVAARHAMRQLTRSQFANFATIPLIFVGGGIGYAARAAAGLGLPLTFLQFSRGFEAEADYLGVQYMYKAGYDPQAYVQFFEKIQAKEKKKPGTLAKAFSSHPQTPDRIEKTQKEINQILPPRPEYIVNTSEFDQVKARLAKLENRRKMTPDQESRPTLRRAGQDNKDKTKSGDQTDDGRPTLKKRDDSNQN
ncbi:MAG: M48 family metalloprotease [Terriglobia bacterium]|nr:M48 family metalloprotease [Terriglobia bacterium]